MEPKVGLSWADETHKLGKFIVSQAHKRKRKRISKPKSDKGGEQKKKGKKKKKDEPDEEIEWYTESPTPLRPPSKLGDWSRLSVNN